MASDSVIIFKLQAAMRQLDTAIWLWFHGCDVVSITQLVDAAIGVLDDLLFYYKRERPILFRPEVMEEFEPGLKPAKVRPLITSAADFAQHARHDPENAYVYKYQFTDHYIWTAILALDQLLGPDRHEETFEGLRGIFGIWYGLAHRESFDARLGSYQDAVQKLEAYGEEFVGNPPTPDVWPPAHEPPP